MLKPRPANALEARALRRYDQFEAAENKGADTLSGTSIGFGIIGLGMIAEFHAKAIAAMADAELVACFSRDQAKADAFASQHGGQGFADLDTFMAHDGLDLVTICTPSGAHLEPALAAAAAGKHVVCEKPLEVTTQRVDQMIAACDEAGTMLAGIFPRRFNPATELLKQAVAEGRFGQINLADVYVKWWRTQAYYDSGAWRGTWALDGGGALMNQSIHTIDLLVHIMGDVKSVRAETRLLAHGGIEVEDTAVAMLEFESGALGVIQGTTASWSREGHPAEVQITGSEGSVFMSDDRFRVWEFAAERDEDARIRTEFGLGAEAPGAGAADPSSIDFRWHQRNLEDAVTALRESRASLVSGQEARRSVALIQAIYKSAADGGAKVEVG